MAQLTPQEQLEKVLVQMNTIIFEEIKKSLMYLGEQCVKRVREDHVGNWLDQTGNLRSSIGYAIYEQGALKVRSAFPKVKDGSEGSSAGEKYIEELAGLYSSTFALVVVAGMNYAAYVEAKESRDVLASTKAWAESKVESYIKRAISKAEKRIEQLL